MCGRVVTKSSADELVAHFGVERRQGDIPELQKRYNGAPGLEYPLIVREPDMPGMTFMLARWGLVPRWIKEARPKVKPINATAETVATNGMFRSAYRSRRALMPIDGYFEWKAIFGSKAKQPYAIAIADGKPFALAAIWESRVNPDTGLEEKTFAVITCTPNSLMAEIHDRMPVILREEDYARWLGEEPDPRDLLKPFPSDAMVKWPISTRVNSVANDDPAILQPAPEADDFTLE